MRWDLQALHREHVVIISLSHKVTTWRREVTTAWMRPVRLARFLLRSSFIEATLHHKERMAADLLAFHSFTLSYTSAYSLIHVLWGVYRRQVSTIGGATLHMVSMSHQRYGAWATMCMYCMRGHEQWLRASLASVEDLYNVSFRRTARVTRTIWHNVLLSRARALWEEAASSRRAYFLKSCSAHTVRHLDQRWTHWATLTKHWEGVAWRERVKYLDTERAEFRVLQLKRRRPPDADPHTPKGRRTDMHLSHAIPLTGLPVWDSSDDLVIQLTGSPRGMA